MPLTGNHKSECETKCRPPRTPQDASEAGGGYLTLTGGPPTQRRPDFWRMRA